MLLFDQNFSETKKIFDDNTSLKSSKCIYLIFYSTYYCIADAAPCFYIFGTVGWEFILDQEVEYPMFLALPVIGMFVWLLCVVACISINILAYTPIATVSLGVLPLAMLYDIGVWCKHECFSAPDTPHQKVSKKGYAKELTQSLIPSVDNSEEVSEPSNYPKLD
jgi:hypothetical protein